jgi:hypothetical protein
MVDRRKKLHRELTAAGNRNGLPISSVTIPNLAAVELMAELREPVTASAPSGPAAAAYRALWQELAGRLGLPATRAGTDVA